MSNTNTGGPAFPAPAGVAHITEQGMTLRDYFAAKCMQGLSALPADFDSNNDSFEMVAKISYAQADAMLKAREA